MYCTVLNFINNSSIEIMAVTLFTYLTLIGHVRYINILAWLRGFRVKIANFSSFFCLLIPKRKLDTKKTTPNIEVWPESLGAMLEYWYIERGLLAAVLWFYFFVFSSVLDISNTYDSVLSHFQNLDFSQNYSAARRIFNSLLGVWKCA